MLRSHGGGAATDFAANDDQDCLWSDTNHPVSCDKFLGCNQRRLTKSLRSYVQRFVTAFSLPYLLYAPYANLGMKVGFIFAPFCVVALIWGYLFIPECKGLK